MPEVHVHAACCELVDDAVRLAGEVRLKVTGASMLPAIRPGDVIRVRRSVPRDLQPGDVVLYRRNGGLTAHRIVRVSEAHLLTRGDSVETCDAPVRFEQIIGQVAGVHRNGRVADCRLSLWKSAVAWMFRRSELCARLFLRLCSKLRECAPQPSLSS